jgi:hypothetical protein
MNALDVPDLAHFSDGRNLVRVRFDATLSYDVPQELAPGDSESAFYWVQLNAETPQVIEGFHQVENEVVALLRLYHDVIDVEL